MKASNGRREGVTWIYSETWIWTLKTTRHFKFTVTVTRAFKESTHFYQRCQQIGVCECVCLTTQSMHESRRLQDDDRQVWVHLARLVVSAERQEDRRAPGSDHGNTAHLQRGELHLSLKHRTETWSSAPTGAKGKNWPDHKACNIELIKNPQKNPQCSLTTSTKLLSTCRLPFSKARYWRAKFHMYLWTTMRFFNDSLRTRFTAAQPTHTNTTSSTLIKSQMKTSEN